MPSLAVMLLASQNYASHSSVEYEYNFYRTIHWTQGSAKEKQDSCGKICGQYAQFVWITNVLTILNFDILWTRNMLQRW